MTPQEGLRILSERVRDYCIGEDELLGRNCVVCYWSLMVIVKVREPTIIRKSSPSWRRWINERATIGAYCIESLWAKRRTKNSRPKTTVSAPYLGAANERTDRAEAQLPLPTELVPLKPAAFMLA